MANHIYLLIVITLDSPHSGPEQVDSCRVIDTSVCASQSRLLSLFAAVSLFSRALSLLTSSTPLQFSLSGETLTHTCIIVVELELQREREREGEKLLGLKWQRSSLNGGYNFRQYLNTLRISLLEILSLEIQYSLSYAIHSKIRVIRKEKQMSS